LERARLQSREEMHAKSRLEGYRCDRIRGDTQIEILSVAREGKVSIETGKQHMVGEVIQISRSNRTWMTERYDKTLGTGETAKTVGVAQEHKDRGCGLGCVRKRE
jgi:hypothetical protein